MITDEERREVARRLRNNAGKEREGCGWVIPWAVFNDGAGHACDETINALADLIEPSCSENAPKCSEDRVKRELKYRARCDELGKEMKRQRDTLLELADEMETFAETEFCAQTNDEQSCDRIGRFAYRIREACGLKEEA